MTDTAHSIIVSPSVPPFIPAHRDLRDRIPSVDSGMGRTPPLTSQNPIADLAHTLDSTSLSTEPIDPDLAHDEPHEHDQALTPLSSSGSTDLNTTHTSGSVSTASEASLGSTDRAETGTITGMTSPQGEDDLRLDDAVARYKEGLYAYTVSRVEPSKNSGRR